MSVPPQRLLNTPCSSTFLWCTLRHPARCTRASAQGGLDKLGSKCPRSSPLPRTCGLQRRSPRFPHPWGGIALKGVLYAASLSPPAGLTAQSGPSEVRAVVQCMCRPPLRNKRPQTPRLHAANIWGPVVSVGQGFRHG